MTIETDRLRTLTADIVAAYVGNNTVKPADVPAAISQVFDALGKLGQAPAETAPQAPKAMVSLRASIRPDYLVSMIDGKRYKMLRRHLAGHGYTPERYRDTFGLPADYPMIAPNYAEERRALAIKIGLGRKPGEKPAKTATRKARA